MGDMGLATAQGFSGDYLRGNLRSPSSERGFNDPSDVMTYISMAVSEPLEVLTLILLEEGVELGCVAETLQEFLLDGDDFSSVYAILGDAGIDALEELSDELDRLNLLDVMHLYRFQILNARGHYLFCMEE